MTALPTSPVELRDLAITADALLQLDSARLHGLVTGGPPVDVERCEEAIAAARAQDLDWTDDDIDHALTEILHQLAQEAAT